MVLSPDPSPRPSNENTYSQWFCYQLYLSYFAVGNLVLSILITVFLSYLTVVGIFRSNSLFIGANCRKAVNEGRADFTPIFLSEIPLLFQRKIIDLDVALIQVSPPDKHGFCTLGPSVDCTRAAIQNAKYIIGRDVC